MEALLNIQIRVIKAQAEASIKQFQSQWNSMQRSMNSGGGAASGIGAGVASSEKGVRNLTGSLRSAGYALTATFTAPIIAAGKQLMDFTMQNQTAFAELQKVYGSNPLGDYTSDLQQLSKLFEALSNQYGVQQSEVIGVGAAWAQAGVQGNELGKAVETTLKAMVIGGLSATDSTEALIAIQAQYGASSGDLIKILNTLNVVENQTGISMGGLIQGFARAAGSAAEAGVDYQHLAAMLAALTPAAGSAAQAGNALKTIISRLLAPTKDASDILGKLGINIGDASWKSATASDRLVRMADAFHGLGQAQKGVVSATIASRFQINRFDILMRDLYNGTHAGSKGLSYYGTSLKATSDANVNAAIAQKELNTVLNSSPRQMAIVTTQIKNDMTKAFQNLIPIILYFTGLIERVTHWFAGLSPTTQKLIGTLLLLTAALGPILLYVSALGSGLKFLRLGFLGLFGPVGKVAGGIGYLLGMLAGGGGKAVGLFGRALGGLGGILGNLSGVIRAAAFGLFSPIGMAVKAMGPVFAGMAALWRTTLTGIVEMVTLTGGLIGNALRNMYGVFLSSTGIFLQIFGRGMMRIVALAQLSMGLVGQALVGGLAGSGRLFAGGIRGIVTGAALSFRRLPIVIFESFSRLGPMLLRFAPLLLRAVTGWIGIAIAIGGALIYKFRDQIAAGWKAIVAWFQSGASGLGNAMSGVVGIFDKAVSFVIGAFNMLPAGVRGALLAVVRIVQSAAMAVYNLFSYLNPFAHHSPSLVENVTAGMAEVAKQFASVTAVSAPILKAYNDIKKFGGALAALGATSAQLDMQKGIGDLTDAGAGAGTIAMYVTLSGDLQNLKSKQDALNQTISTQQTVVDASKASLDAASDAMDRQQKVLDNLTATQQKYQDLLDTAKQAVSNYADTQITGERAMGDAIFANSQAQKQLQLQMMNMEDVTGPIDDVKSKLASLAGEMETLTGTQESLRQAGAGGDILSVYDDQIKALKDQQTATEGAAKQYDDMNAALDKLDRTGQKLDLENSLNFDGLHRQIEQTATALNELPFDQIMKGLKSSQADVDKYTQKYNQATDAVKAQQAVVDSATAKRDKLQGTYDVEYKKLQALQDAYGSLNDAINKVNDSLQTMTDSAQKANDAKKAASGGGGGGEGVAAGNFDAAAGGDFASGNLGAGLGTSSASDMLKQMTQDAVDATKKTFGQLTLVGPLKEKWGEVQKWWQANITPGLAQFGSAVAGQISKIDFAGGLDKLMNSNFTKSLVGTAKTVGKFAMSLGGLFKPEVLRFFNDLVGYFKEVSDKVLPKLLPLGAALGRVLADLWTVLKPLVAILAIGLIVALKLLAAAFTLILGPALKLFADLIGNAVSLLTHVLDFIDDVFHGRWSAAWSDIGKIFGDIWNSIVDTIKGAWRLVYGVFTGMVNAIIQAAKWLYDVLVGHSIFPDLMNAIYQLFAALPGKVIAAIWGLITRVASWAASVMATTLRFFASGWQAIYRWLITLPGSFLAGIGSIVATAGRVGANAFTAILNNFGSVWQSIYKWLTGIPASFLSAIGGVVATAATLGSSIFSALWGGIKSAAGSFSDLASTVGHAILRWIDDIIPHTITIPGFSILGKGVGPWTINAIPHFGAKGGIFDTATNMIIGEAGKEVLIPLTDPQRAWDLVQQSGLLNVVGNYMNSTMPSNNGGAAAKITGMASRSSMSPTQVTNNVRTEQHIHFEGSTLEFPNIKNADDAEAFISNLQHLSGGNV